MADAEELAELRGIAFCLEGRLAWARWSEEAGRHGFKLALEQGKSCLVHVSEAGIAAYQPPEKIDRREGIGGQVAAELRPAARSRSTTAASASAMRWSGDLADEVGLLVEAQFSAHIDDWFALPDLRTSPDFRTL